MPDRILIIETDSTLRTKLVQYLQQKGFSVSVADQTQEIPGILSRTPFSMALLGLEGLKREGISILAMIRRDYPAIKVITLNTGDQLDLSIEAMRMGVYDDFLIPIALDNLIKSIEKGLTTNIQPPAESEPDNDEGAP